MIDASQGMLKMNSQGGEGMSPPMKKHLELQIRTVEYAPRDTDELERLLKAKRRQKEEEAMLIKDTQRLVTEIEMLRIVLHLAIRKGEIIASPLLGKSSLSKKDKGKRKDIEFLFSLLFL
jgi:hypothetical protein